MRQKNRVGGFGVVRIDGQLALPVSWNEASTDIEFVYTLEGSEEVLGPLDIRARDYPGPNVVFVPVSFNGGSIAFSGAGQLIDGFEVRSPSGALEFVTTSDFSPFEVAEERTSNFAKFTSSEPVPVDWIRLPFIKWDRDKGADLEFTFQPTGTPGVPEPSGRLLAGLAAVCLLTLRRRC